MKIKLNGVEYEIEINEKGHVISKNGNIFFGPSEDNILVGELVKEITEAK